MKVLLQYCQKCGKSHVPGEHSARGVRKTLEQVTPATLKRDAPAIREAIEKLTADVFNGVRALAAKPDKINPKTMTRAQLEAYVIADLARKAKVRKAKSKAQQKWRDSLK